MAKKTEWLDDHAEHNIKCIQRWAIVNDSHGDDDSPIAKMQTEGNPNENTNTIEAALESGSHVSAIISHARPREGRRRI